MSFSVEPLVWTLALAALALNQFGHVEQARWFTVAALIVSGLWLAASLTASR